MRIKRFLKRNCIKIPFWIIVITVFGLISNLDKPIPNPADKAPVEVTAEVEEQENV